MRGQYCKMKACLAWQFTPCKFNGGFNITCIQKILKRNVLCSFGKDTLFCQYLSNVHRRSFKHVLSRAINERLSYWWITELLRKHYVTSKRILRVISLLDTFKIKSWTELCLCPHSLNKGFLRRIDIWTCSFTLKNLFLTLEASRGSNGPPAPPPSIFFGLKSERLEQYTTLLKNFCRIFSKNGKIIVTFHFLSSILHFYRIKWYFLSISYNVSQF